MAVNRRWAVLQACLGLTDKEARNCIGFNPPRFSGHRVVDPGGMSVKGLPQRIIEAVTKYDRGAE
jgi:hypothetical protein